MKLHLPKMLLTAVVAAMSVWNAQADTYYLNAADSNNTNISASFTTSSGGTPQATSTNLWKKFCSGQSDSYDGPHKLIIDQARTSTNRIKLDFSPLNVSSLEVTAAAKGTWIGNDDTRKFIIGDTKTKQTSTFGGDLKLQGTHINFVGIQTWDIKENVTVTLDIANVTVEDALTISGIGTLDISKATSVDLTRQIANATAAVKLGSSVSFKLNSASAIFGYYGNEVGVENGGVEGNGYVSSYGVLEMFSNAQNVTNTGVITYTIDNTTLDATDDDRFSVDCSELSAESVYLLKKNETYGESMKEAQKLMVSNGSTLTLNGGLATTLTDGILLEDENSTINLGDDGLLNKSSVATYGNKGKLTGTGTYDLGSIESMDLGAVKLGDFSGTVKATTGKRDINLKGFNDIGAGAKLELSGFTGYLYDDELKSNLILTNSADGYAVRLDNGSSGGSGTATFSGSIEGTGNMVYTWDVVDSGQVYKTTHVFTGDTSQWKGKFVRELIDSAGDGSITIGKLTEVKFTAGGDVFHTDGTGGVEDKAVVSRTSVIIESAKDTTFNGSITNVKDVITNSNTDYKQAITTQAFTVKEAVTVGIFSDVTTTSLTLGTDATLEFAGGVLNLANSYTLNAGCITLAEGLTFKTADDYTLFNVTGENNTLTMEGLDSWSGSNYLINGVEYSTALLQDGNSLKLSFNKVIPEPTTATLSLLALAGLAARRRRK